MNKIKVDSIIKVYINDYFKVDLKKKNMATQKIGQ